MARKRRDDAAAYTFDLVGDDAEDFDAGRALVTQAAAQAGRPGVPVPDAGGPAVGSPGGGLTTKDGPAAPPSGWRAWRSRATTSTQAQDGATYRFELVTDEDDDGDVVAEVRDRVAANRRILVPAVGALAALTIVGATVGTVREHQRAERLRVAAGGVLSLDDAPEERWRAQVPTMNLGFLDGDLFAADAEGVHGIDPQTGDEAWSVALDDAQCGSIDGQWWSSMPDLGQLVCVQGTGDDRTLVVVGPDGAVSEPRRLDPEAGVPHPGPRGTVVLVRRVGEPGDPGDAAVDCLPDSSCSTTGQVASARDIEVRVEDAVTGELRWESAVDAEVGGDTWECVSWSETRTSLDLEAVRVGGGPTLVTMDGCGVHAAWTADGATLGARPVDAPGPFGPSYTEPVPGGYVQRSVQVGSGFKDRFYGPDGTVEQEVDGSVLIPQSSDGTADGFHFVGGIPTLTAYDAGWGTLWKASLLVDRVLAVADGIVVVGGTSSTKVIALDLATGGELWDWTVPPETVSDDGSVVTTGGGWINQAFTDGRIVVVAMQASSGIEMPPVISYGLDLVTGEVVWTDAAPGEATLLSAGGRLYRLEFTPSQDTEFEWSAELVGLG
ncbi:PQQ-binding-like beta-propeller repeat protein [Antribacter sp. KLBMP9083]|uniref:PQQ-binding-like beta-propeller repeat protein n=1 Tax=Antribacter soli TaxID=2910976 RepID=A0AA41QD46_9MICO|nr:PQQ-binding-like beta-propeller repeat protein [Antribacter soli]MCF4120590.1 PQQ-binding-like beta-propeller repeat protein [Antribacter soli]